MIRITSGKFKGKRLEILSKFVRPTSAIKREAFFSIIESYAFKNSYNIYENKIFLDLFAGIGTMGLEAISRGYKYAIFFENNIEVIKSLEKNCKMLCYSDEYKIINEDILKSKIDIDFDKVSVIFIDPPYNKYKIDDLLVYLVSKININVIIAVENSINESINIPKKLKLINKKKYGKTNLSFLVLD